MTFFRRTSAAAAMSVLAFAAWAAPRQKAAPAAQTAAPEEKEIESPYKADIDERGFRPYREILDRMPLGALPPGFNPDALEEDAKAAAMSQEDAKLAEEAQEILGKSRLCALNVNADGKAFAGISLTDGKETQSIYLSEGQEQYGVSILEIDPSNGTVKIAKDGVEAVLSMDGQTKAAPAAQAANAEPESAPPGMADGNFGRRRHHRTRFERSGENGRAGRTRRSFAADLRARRAEEAMAREAREEENRRRSEEVARREREVKEARDEQRAEFEAIRESLISLRAEREAAEQERREREGNGDADGNNFQPPD